MISKSLSLETISFLMITQFQNGLSVIPKNSDVSLRNTFDRISRVSIGVQDELYFFLDFLPPISTISRVDFFSRVASLLTMATSSPFCPHLSRSFLPLPAPTSLPLSFFFSFSSFSSSNSNKLRKARAVKHENIRRGR